MIAGAIPIARVVLYEGNGARALDDQQRYELMRGLLEKGYAVTSTRAGGQVSGVDQQGVMIVLGRFEQEGFGGAQGDAGNLQLRFCEIDGMDLPAVFGVVESTAAQALPNKPSKWKPWFPVIDYD